MCTGDSSAADYFERAVVADPEDAAVLSDFANFISKTLHDPERARAVYQQAAELGPRNESIAGDFALFLSQAGELEEAEALFRRSVVGDIVSVTRLVNFAVFLSQLGKLDEALQIFNRANEFDPNDSNLAFNFGCFHAKRGHVDAALSALERAVATENANDLDWANTQLDNLRNEPRFCALIKPAKC